MIKVGREIKSKSVLTIAERCKNILASNWQGNLNTIKADAEDSKEDIYSSKIKYVVKKGKPYLWVPEKDLHNVNTIIDERGSFSVTTPFPGPLGHVLRSIKKLPARVALTGDVLRLKDEKAKLVTEYLREMIRVEQTFVRESSHAVSTILSSSSHTSPSANLLDLLQEDKERYSVYRFNLSSCMFIDSKEGVHEVNLQDFVKCKADHISRFSMGVIDGINQSEMTRRALILFCITFLQKNAKDAFLLTVDRKGFDVLAKVLGPLKDDGSREYQWEELRLTFKKDADDVESFCHQLVEMEKEALNIISSFSGVGA